MKRHAHPFASSLAQKLAEKNGETQKTPIYEYAIISLFTFGATGLLLSALALALNRWADLFLFLLGFFPARTVWGGYHASQASSCVILSTLHGGLAMFVIPLLAAHTFPWLILGALISVICVYLYAPVSHKNKPQSPVQHRALRLWGRLILILNILTLSLCDRFAWHTAAAGLTFGLLSAAVLCALGHFFNPQADGH